MAFAHRIRPRRSAFLCGAGLAFLAILPPAWCGAQEPSSPASTLRIGTSLVLVDVVVTENGAAVGALEQQRFHILENGREQRIVSFDEHRPAPAGPTPQAKSDPPLPPNVYSNVGAANEAGALNVLLLDDLNTPFEAREFLLQQLRLYCAKKPAGSSLMIFRLGSRLRLEQGFTSDSALLAKTLEKVPAENIPLISLHHAPQITIDALLELARYLATVPGRKNLIWFAGSFPIASDPGAVLSTGRIAVYPVNAKGLLSQPGYSAAFGDLGDTYDRAGTLLKTGAGTANRQFHDATIDEHGRMVELARQTGGTAFVDSNGFAELVAQTVENGSRYYTIGYVPTEKQLDGKFRKIDVKLDGGPLDMAYRRGYYAGEKVVPTGTRAEVTSALASNLPGTPQGTQILFQARILPADAPELGGKDIPEVSPGQASAALKGRLKRYVVDLLVDPRELLFEQAKEEEHTASIEVTLAAYAEMTHLANYTNRRVKLEMKPDRYARTMAKGLPLRLAIDLPEGSLALRIAVRDTVGGKSGSLEAPVVVGP